MPMVRARSSWYRTSTVQNAQSCDDVVQASPLSHQVLDVDDAVPASWSTADRGRDGVAVLVVRRPEPMLDWLATHLT